MYSKKKKKVHFYIYVNFYMLEKVEDITQNRWSDQIDTNVALDVF